MHNEDIHAHKNEFQALVHFKFCGLYGLWLLDGI